MNKNYYTRQEAADILGLTPQSISNYAAKGLLHEVRRGPSRLFSRKEVDALNSVQEFHDIVSMQESVDAMHEEMSQMHAQLSERYGELKEEFQRVITNGHTNNWFRYRQIIMKILGMACDATLTERDREVIFDALEFYNLSDIAQRYGLTRERVRQIIERSIRRIVRFGDIAEGRYESAQETIANLKKQINELNATVWSLEHPQLGKPATEFVTELEKYRETTPFNIKIVEFGVSVRAFNCCRAADIYTIGDLVAHTRLQMIKMRNFGRKSLNELELLLDKLGLNWGMWTDPDYDYTYMRRKTDA